MSEVATQIANLALAHCGISKPMASLDTERSIEAQMCRTWYDTARRKAMGNVQWSFATKQVIPALVATQPTPEWAFAYQYPSDALKLTRFMSWRGNNDTRQSRIDYRVMQPVAVGLSTLATPPASYEASGLWIYTNWPGNNNATPTIIEYTFDNTNVSQWTDDFVTAFSLSLAGLIVTTLTSGEQQLKQQIAQDYAIAIASAQGNNYNEEQRPQDPSSEFIRGRNGISDGLGYSGMAWTAEPAGFVIQ